jgi:hypothetical protein
MLWCQTRGLLPCDDVFDPIAWSDDFFDGENGKIGPCLPMKMHSPMSVRHAVDENSVTVHQRGCFYASSPMKVGFSTPHGGVKRVQNLVILWTPGVDQKFF